MMVVGRLAGLIGLMELPEPAVQPETARTAARSAIMSRPSRDKGFRFGAVARLRTATDMRASTTPAGDTAGLLRLLGKLRALPKHPSGITSRPLTGVGALAGQPLPGVDPPPLPGVMVEAHGERAGFGLFPV